MPTIEVDFDTYKAITIRRAHEGVTEGDVVREALGLQLAVAPHVTENNAPTDGRVKAWYSEGVRFQVGTKLQHRFRSGKVAEGEITEGGVRVNGKTFSGLSPAAAYGAGHQANGWQFWEVLQDNGKWMKADALRHR